MHGILCGAIAIAIAVAIAGAEAEAEAEVVRWCGGVVSRDELFFLGSNSAQCEPCACLVVGRWSLAVGLPCRTRCSTTGAPSLPNLKVRLRSYLPLAWRSAMSAGRSAS